MNSKQRIKRNQDREVRRMRLTMLTNFNADHFGVEGEIRDSLKAALIQNLDRWEAWFRSQPEPLPVEKTKKERKRTKSRMIY